MITIPLSYTGSKCFFHVNEFWVQKCNLYRDKTIKHFGTLLKIEDLSQTLSKGEGLNELEINKLFKIEVIFVLQQYPSLTTAKLF
jgi:hypothetical protein